MVCGFSYKWSLLLYSYTDICGLGYPYLVYKSEKLDVS